MKLCNGSARDGHAVELTAGKLTSKLSARQPTFTAGSARPSAVTHERSLCGHSIMLGLAALEARKPNDGGEDQLHVAIGGRLARANSSNAATLSPAIAALERPSAAGHHQRVETKPLQPTPKATLANVVAGRLPGERESVGNLLPSVPPMPSSSTTRSTHPVCMPVGRMNDGRLREGLLDPAVIATLLRSGGEERARRYVPS